MRSWLRKRTRANLIYVMHNVDELTIVREYNEKRWLLFHSYIYCIPYALHSNTYVRCETLTSLPFIHDYRNQKCSSVFFGFYLSILLEHTHRINLSFECCFP